MQVAFHLRRRRAALPADALLLVSHNTADLARLCAAMRWDPLPPVFAVADGFLLKLPQPTKTAFAGALRLRALSDNLFVPVDADLLPALLPDETAALTRQRGLIFLPGGRVLEFDAKRPVPLTAIVTGGKLERNSWRPLLEPERLADQITEIRLQTPELPPDELLAAGGEGIGTEDPLSKQSSLPARALGKTAFGAGKAMAWLGNLLGLKGLARTGAQWMAAGIGMTPAMAMSVFGSQEAKLRALLKAFREGNIERALRRALPLNDGGRGDVVATNAQLPFHNLFYSLSNLLGDSGGSSVWFSNINLMQELTNEYRRQAELATQRGDYRRAAFIHAKLLRDFGAAAAVLAKGGLHRDAAIIYLKRLGDTLAAAREYEAAGEIDRALELYRQRGEHLLAGDLLRRAGEEERALAEYQLAAKQAVTTGRGHYEAGEIMRTRAGREDLALPYYQTGWAERPAGNPAPCALRLAQSHAAIAATQQLFALTVEAEGYFDPAGNDVAAAEFFNELAQLADRLPRPRDQDHLRDRALMGLAFKIRQRVKNGTNAGAVTSSMLGNAQAWPTAAINDAHFAIRQATSTKRPLVTKRAADTRTLIRARIPLVTAVCQAASSGDILLGFESGEVVCFRPHSGEVIAVTDEHPQILSLACTQDGDAVVVLTSPGPGQTMLHSYVKNVTFAKKGRTTLSAANVLELCSNLAGDGKRFMLAAWADNVVEFLEGPRFVPTWHGALPETAEVPQAVLLLSSNQPSGMSVTLLAVNDRWISHWDLPPPCPPPGTGGGCGREVSVVSKDYSGWSPSSRVGSSLLRHFLSWVPWRGGVDMAGVSSDGNLYFSSVRFDKGRIAQVITKAKAEATPYLTGAVLGRDYVAGVTKTEVQWLRCVQDGLRIIGKADIALPSAIASFRHPKGQELIVVCAEGTVARVPEP